MPRDAASSLAYSGGCLAKEAQPLGGQNNVVEGVAGDGGQVLGFGCPSFPEQLQVGGCIWPHVLDKGGVEAEADFPSRSPALQNVLDRDRFVATLMEGFEQGSPQPGFRPNAPLLSPLSLGGGPHIEVIVGKERGCRHLPQWFY